jgi:hypothetical protein
MAVRPLRRGAALVAAVVLTLLTVLPATPALACSCVLQEPAEAVAAAPAGFVGELTGRAPAGDVLGPGTTRWTFAVEAVVAGDLAPTVDVLANEGDGANCGLMLADGERIGLLLHPTDGGWSSNSCSTHDADTLLAAVDAYPPDPGLATAGDAAEPTSSRGVGWVPLSAVVLAGVAVLGVVAVVVRRTSDR